MHPDNIPATEIEEYDPNLEAQDEDVASGGSNRLMYVLVALVLALVLGYVALPRGEGSTLSAATPSFMLDDASVTAKVPTSASIAAGLKAAPQTAKKDDTGTDDEVVRPSAKANLAARPTAAVAAMPVATVSMAPAAVAAVPEPVSAPAAAEPAAPANVTVLGRIEDENGKPLVGATVLLKGSSKGTSTDANGNYSLEVPGGNDNTLIYGYGGYEDEVMRISGTKPVNVTLTPRAKAGKRRR